MPRKRTELRVALGCLLTAALVLGLVGTTSLLSGDHDAAQAAAPAHAAVPEAHGATVSTPPRIEPIAATTPVEPPARVEHEEPAAPSIAPPVKAATVSLDRAPRLREPAREVRQPKPRLRNTDADRTLASTTRAAAPTTNPAAVPAPAPAIAAPAIPPSEDLYETR